MVAQQDCSQVQASVLVKPTAASAMHLTDILKCAQALIMLMLVTKLQIDVVIESP